MQTILDGVSKNHLSVYYSPPLELSLMYGQNSGHMSVKDLECFQKYSEVDFFKYYFNLTEGEFAKYMEMRNWFNSGHQCISKTKKNVQCLNRGGEERIYELPDTDPKRIANHPEYENFFFCRIHNDLSTKCIKN